jgi:hypothetical protein
MRVHVVPERVTIDNDGARIAEHVLGWMEELGEAEAMTRVILPGVGRPARRQAEALIRKDAERFVWSTQVVSRIDYAPDADQRNPDLPAIDLLAQFASFVQAGQEEGRYDPEFAITFSMTGRKALEQAQVAIDAQLTGEDA